MTVELLHTLSTAALIAAGVLFLLSIILFFVFRIPSLIGILSGSTERKAIENIRHKNEMGESVVDDTDNNRAKSNMADADTERRTGTVKLSTDKLAKEAAETMVLNDTASETTVLDQGLNETTVLHSAAVNPPPYNGKDVRLQQNDPPIFVIEVDIGYAASAEVIE